MAGGKATNTGIGDGKNDRRKMARVRKRKSRGVKKLCKAEERLQCLTDVPRNEALTLAMDISQNVGGRAFDSVCELASRLPGRVTAIIEFAPFRLSNKECEDDLCMSTRPIDMAANRRHTSLLRMVGGEPAGWNKDELSRRRTTSAQLLLVEALFQYDNRWNWEELFTNDCTKFAPIRIPPPGEVTAFGAILAQARKLKRIIILHLHM